jgi:lysophospholipase L1-like esterase
MHPALRTIYYSQSSGVPNYFILGVAGDSNKNGAAPEAGIPTCPAGTLYTFNGTSLVEITNEPVSNGVDRGGFIHQFAIKLKELTGRPTVVVNGAVGGAYVSSQPGSDPANNDWSSTGILYAPWVSDLNDVCTFLDRDVPDLIIFGDGINDVRSSVATATITAAFDNLITRFHTDFPNVPVILTQTGYNGTSGLIQATYDLRQYNVDKMFSDSLVHVVNTMGSFAPASMYDVDLLHLTQAGYNIQGEMFARWVYLDTFDKVSRCVIASQFTDLSTNRMNMIARIVDGVVDRGDYQLLENLSVFFNTTEENAFVDLSLMGFNGIGSGDPTYVANTAYSFNGTSDTLIPIVIPSFCRRSTQNDFIEGCFITANGGSIAYLFGVVNGVTTDHALLQGSTTVQYSCNDATLTVAESVPLTNNQFHGIARNAGTKIKYTGKVQTDTDAVASNGRTSQFNKIGGAGGTSNSGFGVWSVAWYLYSKLDGLDFSSLYDDIEYARAHWND